MADKQQNPAIEPIEKSMQAAKIIQGAVKTGKAISGAAQGAAVGGPAGAAIGFVWSNRKGIAKIAIALIAFLMLPVTILCMLPSVAFGGLENAYSAQDPNDPVLNSTTAIIESTNAICASVDDILTRALAATISSIEKNFKKSSADQMDIINPYASQITYDAVTLVSMYCASKSNDYAAVSLADMEQLLRKHQGQLFSYSWKDEYRQISTTAQETRASIPLKPNIPKPETDTPPTEVWRIYTVRYHGDTLFSGQIFSLTEEQKKLAKDYASNLNLFLQDERFGDSINRAFQKNTTISITGYTDPSTKNNLDLVKWAIYAEQNHWGYVWGTYGRVFTASLYESKLKQYPEEISRYADFITSNWLGGRTSDCVGLIKGYGWLNTETLEVGYGTNGMPDIGSDAMYYNAKEKGAISTIPEIPGLAVWYAGHIGIYIGNGEVIEAKGTKYGVVRTNLSEGKWTHWLKIPYITYS